MWKRLDSDDLIEANQAEVGSEGEGALIEVFSQLSREEWASELFAAMSLGKLRITTPPSWSDLESHGAFAIGLGSSEEVVLTYQPHCQPLRVGGSLQPR